MIIVPDFLSFSTQVHVLLLQCLIEHQSSGQVTQSGACPDMQDDVTLSLGSEMGAVPASVSQGLLIQVRGVYLCACVCVQGYI